MSEVTFEEYKSATVFARWRYKYGLFVLIGCWICLILLGYFVYHYAVELATNPAIYTVNKLGVDYCQCYGEKFSYYINRTSVSYMESLFSP